MFEILKRQKKSETELSDLLFMAHTEGSTLNKKGKTGMTTISFVILHYKDLETTDRCVRSILAMGRREQENLRIVIVDNDVRETVEYREKIVEKYAGIPEVTVLQAKEDRGFSYANNLGYAYARERQHADFILVLNNDIEFVQRNFPARLEAAYREHPCEVLAPDIVRAGTREHQNPMDDRIRTEAQARYTWRMNTLALKYYDLLYPLLYLVNRLQEYQARRRGEKQGACCRTARDGIVPFGALLIFTPRFVAKEKKAFFPETGFYYEEYILTRRCEKNGYRIVYTPALRALHEGGGATRKSFRDEKKRMHFRMEQTAASSRIYLKYFRKTEKSAEK